MKRHVSLWLIPGLAWTLLAVCANQGLTIQTTPDAQPRESELQRAEKQVSERLAELNKLKEAEVAQQKVVMKLTMELDTLKKEPTPDEKAIAQKMAALQSAMEAHARDQKAVQTAQTLYDTAAENLKLVKKIDELQAKKPEKATNDKPTTAIDEALQKKSKVTQAKQESSLAQQYVNLLRKQLDALNKRRQEIPKELEDIQQRLKDKKLASKDRASLQKEKQELEQEGRDVDRQILEAQEKLQKAVVQQQLKQEEATHEEATFARWKNELYVTGGLFGALFVIVILSRIFLMRRIKDPQRRYYVKRSFSLFVMAVFLVGLGFIFSNRFSNLLTLIGLAMAGIAIALQDLIASFVAWFFIRGARTYRVGDWVQIGDQCGEVIDVTFLRTTLQQAEPFSIDHGHRGGNLTGGITTFLNNRMFKHSVVNYTKGFPFLWCSLRYVLTFESDWESARQRLFAVLREEPEIKGTAEKARDKIEKMAEDFSIKSTPTEPTVLTWTAGIGVELTVWFLAHPRRRVALIDKVNCSILKAVAQMDNAGFAYHTIRSIPTPLGEASTSSAGNGRTSVTTR